MKFIDPREQIRINDYIIIAEKSWPKNYFREISDFDVIKKFYNDSYQNFENEIEVLLEKFHPASWVRAAYIQLELYTLELHTAHIEKKDLTSVPYLFIPVARYGWRYIIEKSLEKLESYDSEIENEKRPDDESISKVFTLLIGLNYTNEISNYLHFFKDKFKDIKIVFSSSIYSTFPTIKKSDRLFFDNVIKYIGQKVDYAKVPDFNFRKNEKLLEKINTFLISNFNFVLKDIETILFFLRDKVSVEINATNLIIATDELALLISERNSLKIEQVQNIINFIFLDTSIFHYQKRDFLKRSQNIRMLNYSGCKFKLTNNLKTIYDNESSNWEHIKSAESHSIISFVVLAEWSDNFISRLAFGQRTDLKSLSTTLNKEITNIEDYFHRNIFENAIRNILINKNIPSLSINKVNKKNIPCGEIDAVAVDKENKILYIIEAKNTAPTKDARAFAKNIKDHFKQKKYDLKFSNKINWVEKNLSSVSEIFGVEITNDYLIEKYYITGNPSPIKFLVTDYSVMTFYEFYQIINERYR